MSNNNKATGWTIWETIEISIINVCRCEGNDGYGGCNKLINYNGLPPQFCPVCGSEIEFYKELMKKYDEQDKNNNSKQ